MYFTNCNTEAEIKAELKTLYKRWHPDKYADPAMKAEAEKICFAFTEEYHAKLKNLDGTTYTKTDNSQGTYYYNQEKEQEVIDKLAEILAAELPGCTIMLIGKWIWVEGDTKPLKDTLGKNGLGLIWHSKRLCWYWKPAGSRSRYNRHGSLGDLADAYGYSEFAGREKERQQNSRRRITV